MNLSIYTRRGFLSFVFLLAVVIGVVHTLGSGWQKGVQSFAVVFGGWLLLSFLPWSRLELLQSHRPDERQGALGMEAAAVTGIVMVWVALGGAMVDAAQGREGEFGLMATVGGATFLVACLILPRVRR